MKKNFYFLLMAALVCGLSLSVTSCKDDDSDNNGKGSEEQSDNEGLSTLENDQLPTSLRHGQTPTATI